MEKSSLIIVSGATGSLGKEYLDYFSKKRLYRCIGLCRNDSKNKLKNVEYLYSDLLNKEELNKSLNKINLKNTSRIIFIHCVGKFKFELLKKPFIDRNNDGIDDEVFASNFKTFINVLNFLLKNLPKDKKLILCSFGSISDKYNVPYWKSYTFSKNQLRILMKNISKKENIRSIFINVSTTSTERENKLRPFANKSYWLQPKKIVRKSIKKILMGKNDYEEFDIFEFNPSFEEDYFENPKKIIKKWSKETGL